MVDYLQPSNPNQDIYADSDANKKLALALRDALGATDKTDEYAVARFVKAQNDNSVAIIQKSEIDELCKHGVVMPHGPNLDMKSFAESYARLLSVGGDAEKSEQALQQALQSHVSSESNDYPVLITQEYLSILHEKSEQHRNVLAGPEGAVQQEGFKFSAKNRARLYESYAKSNKSDADINALIDSVEKTGCAGFFGYASLIGNGHTKAGLEWKALVKRVQRNFSMGDREYRGMPDRLGVTLGATPTGNDKDVLRGLVQVICISDYPDEDTFVDAIILSNEKFLERETSGNPIYTYPAVKVYPADDPDGEPIIVQMCMSDPDNPLFLGEHADPGETYDYNGPMKLTLEEKVAIQATSWGAPGASIRNTGRSYANYVLQCDYMLRQEPEDHIKEQCLMVNSARAAIEKGGIIPQRALDKLHNLEDVGPEGEARKWYDERAFDKHPDTKYDDPEFWRATLASAKMKMDIGDPLTQDQLVQIEQQKLDLKVSIAKKEAALALKMKGFQNNLVAEFKMTEQQREGLTQLMSVNHTSLPVSEQVLEMNG